MNGSLVRLKAKVYGFQKAEPEKYISKFGLKIKSHMQVGVFATLFGVGSGHL